MTKIHLYEFATAKKKLKCLCGWERTLKTTDPKLVRKVYADHLQQEADKTP